ncbi:helix-turn-helix domain-containing protein [Luteimonas sp. A277]
MKIADLIDQARAKRGITSDTAVADHFGLNRQSVSKWRKGEAYPTQDHITELAEMAGESAAQWLVAIQAEREKGKAGQVWTALAKQLGAAAVLVLAVALPWPAKAQAEPDAAIYIMRN